MINKSLEYIKRHKILGLVICVALLAIFLIVVLIIYGGDDESSKTKKPSDLSPPKYTYTYHSSDVTCKQVQPNPSTPETVNTCAGTLKVKSNNSSIVEVKVTPVTIFYNNNGAPLDTIKLNQLTSGKSKLAITLSPNSNQAINILSEAQLN